jgi:hypothetical protein
MGRVRLQCMPSGSRWPCSATAWIEHGACACAVQGGDQPDAPHPEAQGIAEGRSVKTYIKQAVMALYNHGLISDELVKLIFKWLDLKSH